MITDANLLQANTTIITGILIFLSITPIFKEAIAQLLEKTFVMGALIFIMSMLLGSTLALFFLSDATWMPIPGFYVAAILFVGGLSGVLGLVIGLSFFYRRAMEYLREKGKP